MVSGRFQYKVLRKTRLMGVFLRRIEQKYGLSKIAGIQTHMTNEEKVMLFWLIKGRQKQVRRLVEIGSYLGASSCYLSEALSNEARLICVDTWGNHAMTYNEGDVSRDGVERDTFKEFSANTAKYKDVIIPVRGWSSEMIGDVKNIFADRSVDFLFIDGDHSYDGVKTDWMTYKSLLKPGSIVAFHDTGWAEGVQQLIRESIKPIAKPLLWLPNLEVYQLKQ